MKKFKDIRINVNATPKATFGTNPKDPWSAKYNIAEGLLDQYLSSKGFDPRVVTPNQKVSYAKSSAFIKWKKDRMAHHVQGESYNGTIEDEQITEITTTGYHKAAIKSRQDAAVKVMSSMGKDKQAKTKLDARNRGLKRLSDRTSAEMKKANSGPQKPVERKPSSMSSPQAYYASKKPGEYTGDSVEHPEDTNVISEISNTTLDSYKEKAKKSADDLSSKGQYKKSTNRWSNVMKATGKQIDKTTASIKKHLNKEDKFQDSYAATQTVGMEVDTDSIPPKNKRLRVTKEDRMKSARIIKSIYKKNKMAEETYDWEKEDKSVKTYGKKPSMSLNPKEKSFGENKPDAAAVMSGGKTLTGEKRDNIEIDPMMKIRPGSVVIMPTSKKSPQ